MRSSDWSSDVCSSDLGDLLRQGEGRPFHQLEAVGRNNIEHRILVENVTALAVAAADEIETIFVALWHRTGMGQEMRPQPFAVARHDMRPVVDGGEIQAIEGQRDARIRSEEHTSELQSLMRISYAVFSLKKNNVALQLTTDQTFLR